MCVYIYIYIYCRPKDPFFMTRSPQHHTPPLNPHLHVRSEKSQLIFGLRKWAFFHLQKFHTFAKRDTPEDKKIHEDFFTWRFKHLPSTESIFAQLAAISISSSPYHPSYTPQSSVFPNQKSRSCADPPLMLGTRWWEDAFLLLLKKAAKKPILFKTKMFFAF